MTRLEKTVCCFAVPVFAGLVLLPACGSNVSGRTSLAQARTSCLEWDPVGTADDDLWLTTVITFEALRNAGLTRLEVIGQFINFCSVPENSFGD